jgi:hypothetical protein
MGIHSASSPSLNPVVWQPSRKRLCNSWVKESIVLEDFTRKELEPHVLHWVQLEGRVLRLGRDDAAYRVVLGDLSVDGQPTLIDHLWVGVTWKVFRVLEQLDRVREYPQTRMVEPSSLRFESLIGAYRRANGSRDFGVLDSRRFAVRAGADWLECGGKTARDDCAALEADRVFSRDVKDFFVRYRLHSRLVNTFLSHFNVGRDALEVAAVQAVRSGELLSRAQVRALLAALRDFGLRDLEMTGGSSA